MWYLYEHIRADDLSVFYVGKGRRRRIGERFNRSAYWKHIVNKHGYKYRVVGKYHDENVALKAEIALISFYKRIGVNLCNLTSGGDGVSGYRHTELTKSKMTGMFKKGDTPWNKGKEKPYSDSSIEKMRAAKIGKKQTQQHINNATSARTGLKRSNEVRQAMSVRAKNSGFSKLGATNNIICVRCVDTGAIFDSISHAARECGCYPQNISKCCRGKLKTTGGYRWEYYNKERITT